MKSSTPGDAMPYLTIIGLVQAIIYTGLWLWNEYVATYLSIIFPGMILVILIISTIADLIEPSRIPKWYYGIMLISIFIPVMIGIVFFIINGGLPEFGI